MPVDFEACLPKGTKQVSQWKTFEINRLMRDGVIKTYEHLQAEFSLINGLGSYESYLKIFKDEKEFLNSISLDFNEKEYMK